MKQSEIWRTKDPHAGSFRSLSKPLAGEIARLMGLPEGRPEEWSKCTRCHVGETDPSHRGAQYTLEEGVSCEACHGRAEGWLVPHVLWDATHTTNLARGMTDLKDLAVRARRCLSCHSRLDHEIVAAGHPDLSFELLHHSFWQPPHWNYREASPFAFWAMGQAVALETALEDLSQAEVDPTTGKSLHVEAFDKETCFACHHKLSQDRWRQVEGHFAVYRPLVELIAPKQKADELVNAVTQIGQLMESQDPSSAAQVKVLAQSAAEMAKWIEGDVKMAANKPPSEALLRDLVVEISQPLELPQQMDLPSPQIPGEWMLLYFDIAEQKALALKCLALAQVKGEAHTQALTEGVHTTAEIAEQRRNIESNLKTLDALWGFVESPTPEARLRQFDAERFNQALSSGYHQGH
jgi:hypothetical protein